MDWLVVLHAAGGLVLVFAGLGKLRSPEPVSAALKSLRLPSGQIAVGLIAGAELVIGVAGAIAGASWMAWVVAGEWVLLALVALLLARKPQVPCGCFGAASEPAGVVHVLVDLAFAGIAVATVLTADVNLSEAADEARGGWGGVAGAVVLLAIAVRWLLSTSVASDAAAVPPLASGPALAGAPPAMPTSPPTLEEPSEGHGPSPAAWTPRSPATALRRPEPPAAGAAGAGVVAPTAATTTAASASADAPSPFAPASAALGATADTDSTATGQAPEPSTTPPWSSPSSGASEPGVVAPTTATTATPPTSSDAPPPFAPPSAALGATTGADPTPTSHEFEPTTSPAPVAPIGAPSPLAPPAGTTPTGATDPDVPAPSAALGATTGTDSAPAEQNLEPSAGAAPTGASEADVVAPTAATTAGSPAPAPIERVIAGVTPGGAPIELDLVGGTQQTLLAFLTDTCVTCREFWAAFGDGAAPPDTDVVIVTMGPEDESVELITRLAPTDMPTVMSSQAWDDYGIAAGPYFVLVDPDGAVVTHGPAATVASLDAMLTAAQRR